MPIQVAAPIQYNVTVGEDNTLIVTTGIPGPAGQGFSAGGTTGQFLQKASNADFDTEWTSSTAVVNWGDVLGTLSAQTDLQLELNGKSDTSHNHTGTYEPADATILKDADIGVNVEAFASKNTGWNLVLGSGAGQVAEGDHNHSGTYEPADATILKDADIGVNVQAYDATILVDADIGVNVASFAHNHSGTYEPANANIQSHISDGTLHFTKSSINIADLGDVVTGGSPVLADGQVLVYNGANWVNGDAAAGVIDHGALTGLADDDHTQYLLVGGTRSVSGTPTFTKIENTTDGNSVSFELLSNYNSDGKSVLTIGSTGTGGHGVELSGGIANYLEFSFANNTNKSRLAPNFGTNGRLDITSSTGTGSLFIEGNQVLDTADVGVSVQAYSATNALTGDITYETLNTNGDVGTGVGTLAIGNHLHTGVYEPAFTKNTAFNSDFGTGSPQVARGNHLHVGVYEPADATILKDADIGVNVQAYDATYLVDADIGVNVQAYDATYLVDADIGVNVEAYDATILKDADISSTVAPFTTLVNNQVGTTYELVLTDAQKNVTMTNAAASVLTVPANASVAFPIGSSILISQMGAGQVTVAITTDTLNVASTFTLKLAEQWSEAVLTKKTATMWVLSGDLELV